MSSLRNSLHRRNHKERSQLSHRSRFGILEKHKDYVLRARDYHSKQDRIQRLKQKAAERNKDEFYFGMVKKKIHDGVHVQDRGNTALPIDMVKVLKSQDENYIRTVRAAGLKKIEKLKAQLTTLADLFASDLLAGSGEEELNGDELEVLRKAGIIGSSQGSSHKKAKNHIIFVDNEAEARAYAARKKSKLVDKSDITMDNDDIPELGWKRAEDSKGKKKRRQMEQASSEADAAMAEELVKERHETASKHRGRLLKELSARLARDTQLRYAERELEMQRLLMGKGGRIKLKGVERVDDGEDEDEDEGEGKAKSGKGGDDGVYKPRVYKWRLERKR